MKYLLILFFLTFQLAAFAQTESEKYLGEAKKEYEKKNYFSAKELYDKAISADKKNTEAYFGRGNAKMNLKDLDGAMKDFEKTIKLDSKHYGAYLHVGLVYSAKEDYNKAILYYDKAIKVDPKNRLSYMDKAFALFKLEEYEKSAEEYGNAIKCDSTVANAYLYRADCYNHMGKWQAALDDLEKCLIYDSTEVIAKINLAFGNLALGNINTADSLYGELYKTESQNPYVLSNYGYTRHMKGQTEAGIKMINESLRLFPENSYAYKYLAQINIDLKKTDEACKAIRKGLELGFTKDYGKELEELQMKYCN